MLRHSAVVLVLAVGLTATACARATNSVELSRESAITIARQQVSFNPSTIEARKGTSGSTPVWRITLRGRLPGQPPMLFETRVVEIDRRTGAVVSVART
jgi:hypothetical protein